MGEIKKLFFSMFKVGLIGFGGGNALIPILEQTAVDEEKMVTEEAYEEDVIVASITPGALPVEIAGGIGRRFIGTKGLLIGSMAMALPGVILTVLMSCVITSLNAAVLLQIRYVAVGVTAFICCLLTEYIVTTDNYYKEGKLPKFGVVVSVLVLILTCGKNLYRIIGLDMTPFFSIATIHIFVMSFFLLLYMGGELSCIRLGIGCLVCGVYICCVGSAEIIGAEYVKYMVVVCMIFLSAYGCVGVKKGTKGEKIRPNKELIRKTIAEVAWIALIAGIFIIIAIFIAPKAALYLGNGFLSSVMSFGGGDAYLTVADGLFVHTELISEEDFYNYLVPIVNILPGSILCKTLSGIGYFLGFSAHGCIWEGLLVAFAGFFVSLLASCGVFDLIGCFYASFRDMYFIKGIRNWIRSIVSGLMVTVMLSLVWQNVKLGEEIACGVKPLLLMMTIYLVDIFMVYNVKMKNGIIVFLSAMAAFIACNIMTNG